MYNEKPLISWTVLLKGFLAGGLFAGMFLLEYSVLIKFLVFLYGLFVMLDILMPWSEEKNYPVISLMGLFIGFIAASATGYVGFNLYVPAIIVITTLLYFGKFLAGLLRKG